LEAEATPLTTNILAKWVRQPMIVVTHQMAPTAGGLLEIDAMSHMLGGRF